MSRKRIYNFFLDIMILSLSKRPKYAENDNFLKIWSLLSHFAFFSRIYRHNNKQKIYYLFFYSSVWDAKSQNQEKLGWGPPIFSTRGGVSENWKIPKKHQIFKIMVES